MLGKFFLEHLDHGLVPKLFLQVAGTSCFRFQQARTKTIFDRVTIEMPLSARAVWSKDQRSWHVLALKSFPHTKLVASLVSAKSERDLLRHIDTLL